MRRQKDDKLNRLQQLPEGQVVTTRSLAADGYSRQLLAKYVGRHWLEKVGHGVFRRPGPPLKWQHVVYSLQAQGLSLHPGGETSLALLGRAHQLPLSGQMTVHLYGSAKLPSWTARAVPGVRFRHHTDALFEEHVRSTTKNVATTTALGLQPHIWGPWDWALRISSLERAWLEVLQGVPKELGFDEVDELATGLQSLRPKAMDALLGSCKSYKVRRLAVWLAERHQHAWLSKINLKALDLGRGKRALAPGGRLLKRYGITVPKHLADGV